jgi:RHS repeat-associated protein
VDQDSGQSLTTTWTWDTAANGIGKLADLQSPDGDKSYTYTGFGQLHTITLAVAGQSETMTGRLDYDMFGRVGTITYPTPAGSKSFAVVQDHDGYGHVVTVRDAATSAAYWHLANVDDAGRFRQEVFGNGVSTTRSYFADKQSLQSIVTKSSTGTVQNLAYGYDARLNLASRTDALQPQNTTERFRYDSLDRLKCAYFSVTEDPSAPCALSYDHAPNGNLTFKSDVGTLSYTDPKHPHAVIQAGSDGFGYDAVGNQTARPGGVTVSYTPFDLPKAIAKGAQQVAAFAYDGDEKRIHKITASEETIYFEDLYERAANPSSPSTPAVHRFYVRSPERVVAIVGRGGVQTGTLYVHVDHLGSTDVLTDGNGSVTGRMSYDPFGAARNPTWGDPSPPPAPKTTVGFTGHEGDTDLGLVNMKGRIYDPKVGRFLTTDPIVSAPLFGQSWNAYSYVLNNPLSYVDPTGFEYVTPPVDPEWAKDPAVQRMWAASCVGQECRSPPPKEGSNEEKSPVGPTLRARPGPTDVGTTGDQRGDSAPAGDHRAERLVAASPGSARRRVRRGVRPGAGSFRRRGATTARRRGLSPSWNPGSKAGPGRWRDHRRGRHRGRGRIGRGGRRPRQHDGRRCCCRGARGRRVDRGRGRRGGEHRGGGPGVDDHGVGEWEDQSRRRGARRSRKVQGSRRGPGAAARNREGEGPSDA